jgi:hypothetical protein
MNCSMLKEVLHEIYILRFSQQCLFLVYSLYWKDKWSLILGLLAVVLLLNQYELELVWL